MHGLIFSSQTASGSPGIRRADSTSALTDCVIAAAAVLVCRLLASLTCHLYDDAFITFRIAENFAQGQGFVYNPGAPWEPVLGTTTPAHACILALAALAGLKLTLFSTFFNAACDTVTALLLLRCFAGRSSRGGWLAVLAFASLPELNRTAAGGMESSLFVTLLLAAFSSTASRRLTLAGLAAALATTVRPEGILVFPVLLLCPMRPLRQACRLLAPAVLGLLAYTLTLTSYFGTPIPHCVLAKAALYGGLEGWRRVSEIVTDAFAPSWPMIAALPLTVVGCASCLRAGGVLRAYSIYALSLTAAYLAARPMMFDWYYPPVLTADCLWIGSGVVRLLESGTPSLVHRVGFHWRGISIGTAALAVSLVGATAYRLGPSLVDTRIYQPLQRWADQNASPRTTIMACDIGCLGYVTKARILDSGGLVWPEARRHPQEPALLKRYQPDYAFIIASPARIKVMQTDADLARLYEPVLRFNAGNDDRTVLPESSLTRQAARTWAANWHHDYILYQRRTDAGTVVRGEESVLDD
jgi:hypothetical protein